MMKMPWRKRGQRSSGQGRREEQLLTLGACLPRPGASCLRSRRGSAMVEAAMVLPLLILSVLTCILICMFFYKTTLQQCQLHQALRCQAGILTGSTQTLTAPDYEADDLKIGRQGVFRTVSGTTHTAILRRMLLRERAASRMESRWYVVDGVRYVRHCSLVKGSGD